MQGTAVSARLRARCAKCYDVDVRGGCGLNHDQMAEREHEPHLPPPTLWPIGFAIGIAVVLVGLIVDPVLISSIGGAIAIVFGFLWARAATAELRGTPVVVEAETHELRGAGTGQTGPSVTAGEAAMAPPAPGERFPRNKFLEF